MCVFVRNCPDASAGSVSKGGWPRAYLSAVWRVGRRPPPMPGHQTGRQGHLQGYLRGSGDVLGYPAG